MLVTKSPRKKRSHDSLLYSLLLRNSPTYLLSDFQLPQYIYIYFKYISHFLQRVQTNIFFLLCSFLSTQHYEVDEAESPRPVQNHPVSYQSKMRIQTWFSKLWSSNNYSTLAFLRWLLLNSSKQPDLAVSCKLNGIKSLRGCCQAYSCQSTSGTWRSLSRQQKSVPLEKMSVLDKENN